MARRRGRPPKSPTEPKVTALQVLQEERDRLARQLEAFNHRLGGLDAAIDLLAGKGLDPDVPANYIPFRSGDLRALIKNILREIGNAGLSTELAVEIARKRGIGVIRSSVGSTLSRLHRMGVITRGADGLYRLKEAPKDDRSIDDRDLFERDERE